MALVHHPNLQLSVGAGFHLGHHRGLSHERPMNLKIPRTILYNSSICKELILAHTIVEMSTFCELAKISVALKSLKCIICIQVYRHYTVFLQEKVECTNLALVGPTLSGSKVELAVKALSGISPVCIPSAMLHWAKNKEKKKNSNFNNFYTLKSCSL